MKNEVEVIREVKANVQVLTNGVAVNCVGDLTAYSNLEEFFEVLIPKVFPLDLEEAKKEDDFNSGYPFLLAGDEFKKGYQVTLSVSELPNFNEAPTRVKSNEERLREILDETKDRTDLTSDDLEGIRLSVNEKNAYSTEVLKKFDFSGNKERFGVNTQFLSDLVGKSMEAFYQQELKQRKGEMDFLRASSRITFTIIAKYYEAMGGKKAKMVDELEELKSHMRIIAYKLRLMELNNNLVPTKEIGKLVEVAFKAIKVPNLPNKGMAIEFLRDKI